MANIVEVISRVHFFSCLTVALSAQLYPYGTKNGDRVNPKLDDACSIVYNQTIVMFGKRFSKIYVSQLILLSFILNFSQMVFLLSGNNVS